MLKHAAFLPLVTYKRIPNNTAPKVDRLKDQFSHTGHLGDVLLDFLGASVAVHGHLELHCLHKGQEQHRCSNREHISNYAKVPK